jgi:uncharacterized protein YjiK
MSERAVERVFAAAEVPASSLLRGEHAGGPPLGLVVFREQELDVPGASAVVALGSGRFAVVDDDKGVYQVGPDGGERVVSSKKRKLKDLEGLCRAPDGASLLALSERTGRVVRIALGAEGDVVDEAPEEVGQLPEVGRARNKGWEGLDLLPGACCPDGRDRLVAVHEGHPRRVGVFALPSLEAEALLKVPADAKDHALDLSDVAVDRGTGRLLLLSDESATVVEVALVGSSFADAQLETVSVHALDLSRDEKPEALDVDADGTLWLATDREARLYALRLER